MEGDSQKERMLESVEWITKEARPTKADSPIIVECEKHLFQESVLNMGDDEIAAFVEKSLRKMALLMNLM